MRIFITGGCKNGKSTLARRLAVAQRNENGLFYVATMVPMSPEDEACVARHRAERASDGFMTIEQPSSLSHLLSVCPNGASFLIDSLTALMQNEMFREDFIDHDAHKRVVPQLKRVINSLDNAVIVSDFIFSDSARYDPTTERYREALAFLDRTAAALCDTVLEVNYSGITTHKGGIAT